jgi:hypothetical protein
VTYRKKGGKRRRQEHAIYAELVVFHVHYYLDHILKIKLAPEDTPLFASSHLYSSNAN